MEIASNMENTVVIIVDFNVKEFVDIPIGIDASDLIGQSYLSPEGASLTLCRKYC
jgi:hypothetical protein